MTVNLYVGNLAFETGEAELRALFEEGGRKVSEVKIITDRDTGISRGFGFVEMAKPEDAEVAIRQLNGTSFGGRALKVNVARERPPRRSGGPGGAERKGGDEHEKQTR
jgi:RNA recognition motif-containing protein